MIDRFTRWPEAVAIANITAETCARALLDNWICRFGVPTRITTDRGTQFESALFTSLRELTGMHRIRTTSYHPPSNGLVERFHRQLKAALKCHDNVWTQALPLVMLGIRSSIKEDIDTSPAELVYGTSLRLPADLVKINSTPNCFPHTFAQELKERMRRIQYARTTHHGEHEATSQRTFTKQRTLSFVLTP